MNDVIVKVSIPKYYCYNDWKFEHTRTKPFPPWPIKNNFELREKAGIKFYNDISKFLEMTDSYQEKYRIYPDED